LTHFHFSKIILDGFHGPVSGVPCFDENQGYVPQQHPKAQSTVTLFDILSHGFKSKFRQSSVFSAFAAAMKPDRPPVTHHFPQTPQTFSLISFPQMEERATKTSNEKRASDKC